MDILEPALSLEEAYYAEGLALGQADGSKAGLVEGRRFGLEQGFEKFASIARLHGRSIVWNSRTRTPQAESTDAKSNLATNNNDGPTSQFLPDLFNSRKDSGVEHLPQDLLPPLDGETISLSPLQTGLTHSRAQKHIVTLYALTEIESLSIENTEAAVSDFDDRYRRAIAKASIIGRIVGESVDVRMNPSENREESGARLDGSRVTEGEDEVEDIVRRRIEAKSNDQDAQCVGGNDLETEIR